MAKVFNVARRTTWLIKWNTVHCKLKDLMQSKLNCLLEKIWQSDLYE